MLTRSNSENYQNLMKDYHYILRVAKSENNGIIKEQPLLHDSNSLFKAVTDETIEKVPKLNIFQDEVLDTKYQQANQNLLKQVKNYEVGIEMSCVYDENMNQIGTYRLGEDKKTKINNPDVLYHAFHNHPSGEVLSPEDLLGLTSRQNMLSITAIGNNGNVYCVYKTLNSDSDFYNVFIQNEMDTPYFLEKYSYNDLNNHVIEISDLDKEQKEILKQQIVDFGNYCCESGALFGFEYCKQINS